MRVVEGVVLVGHRKSDAGMTGGLPPGRVPGCGVTAARKVDEQVALLERRGARVEWAPALSLDPNHVDDAELRAATGEVLARPVDMFLATTGVGMKAWFAAAARWGMREELVAAVGGAEILARGPKSVGALRAQGLRELWAPESECFEDVLAHLRGRDLTGLRIVVQEHGQSLSMVAHALRRQGADVTVVTVYRVAGADDPAPMFRMVDLVAERKLDAVTFTSAPAVAALMDAAGVTGRRDEVVGRLPGRRRRDLRRPGDRGRVRAVGRAHDPPGALPAGRDGQADGDRAAGPPLRDRARGRRPPAAAARRPGAPRRGRGADVPGAARRCSRRWR